jgi:hypothetical protein
MNNVEWMTNNGETRKLPLFCPKKIPHPDLKQTSQVV